MAEALATALGATQTVVCPAFPANGRTLYLGHLFVGDVPLAESGMRDHPVTPMTDSDIRRWLARQAKGPVGNVSHAVVRQGVKPIAKALTAHAGLVVVDAIDDGDLRAIGQAVADAPLVTGGSALAMGLPDNFRAMGMSDTVAPQPPAAVGPAIVLAGSCSVATNRQVARYAEHHPAMPLDVDALMAGEAVVDACERFLMAHRDDAPLVYSTAAPAMVGAMQARYDAGMVAERIERTLSELARRAVARGVKRIVVAGGETSGAVTMAVRPGPLTVGPMIAPGVPAIGNGDIALALKSGNFGDDDFLATAVAALGRAA